MIHAKRRLAGILAVAPLLGFGVTMTAATDASAAAGSCTLRIDPEGLGLRMVVRGVPRSPGPLVRFRAYGEDTWYDDYLFTWNAPQSFRPNPGALDEDWEGRDEIYVKCLFWTATGAEYEIKSNVIKKHF